MSGGGLLTLVNLEELYIGHNAIETVEGEGCRNASNPRLPKHPNTYT